MGEPYVREYEVETDITTVVIFDHRAEMAAGPRKETKLDYARQVALLFVDSVHETSDPLGYYAVGDGGLTERRKPATGQYSAIKNRVRSLTPTESGGPTASGERRKDDSALSQRLTTRLSDRNTFETTLKPYFETNSSYIKRINDDPLFGATRTALSRRKGTVWTVIFTDDTRRTELYEIVKMVRRGDGRVLVFLTPSALFDPGRLTDIEESYKRYREFESFRHELASLRRVSAYEVGPKDRIDAILSSSQQRKASSTIQ